MRAAVLWIALLCAGVPTARGISPSPLFEGIIAADAVAACPDNQVCLYLVYGTQSLDAAAGLAKLPEVSYTEQIQPGMLYAVMNQKSAKLAMTFDSVFWVRRIPSDLKIDRSLKALIDNTGTSIQKNNTYIYAKLNIAGQGNANSIAGFMQDFAAGMFLIGAGSVDTYPTKGNKIASNVPYAKLKTVVEWLAGNPLVQWIEERKLHKTSNKYAVRATQSTSGTTKPVFDQGIDGTGEVIGVADTGVDYDHCGFYDRDRQIKICPTKSRTGTISLGDQDVCKADQDARKIVLYRWFEDQNLLGKQPSCTGNWPCRSSNVGDTLNGHGTHVAGSAAAKADSTNTVQQAFSTGFDGAAPGAKLVIDDISPGIHQGSASLEGIPDDLETGLFPITYGATPYARIHSNSWGSTSNAYTTFSQEVDSFMYNQDDFLVLVAAGNEGDTLGSVGSPATCKNCLTIGATSNTQEAGDDYKITGMDLLKLMDLSSRGPTSDLRIKPEVLCPGSNIKSAQSDGSLTSTQCGEDTELLLSGTSMATPHCAGSVALIRQYLREGWAAGGKKKSGSFVSPSASLLKAFMIHSARPVKVRSSATVTTAVNMESGYGLVDLSSVLYFQGNDWDLNFKDDVSMANGDTVTYVYKVDSSSRFRVTLVWTDPPGNPAAFFQLQNNLDLVVQGPSNQFWYGNDFRTVTESYTTRDFDVYNPSEQVTIDSPLSGTYKIQVRGVRVRDRQKFSLVITGRSLQEQADSAISSCPNDCNGQGTCNEGRCECRIDRLGDDCGVQMPILKFDGDTSIEVSANGFGYYIFYKQRSNAKYTLTFSGTKDPDYFIGYNRRPTPTTFDLILAKDGATGVLEIPAELPRGFYVLGVLAYGDDITATVKMATGDDKCGDGVKNANEQCDDGNTVNGDGCTWWCRSVTTENKGQAPMPSAPGNMFKTPDQPGTADNNFKDPNMNAAGALVPRAAFAALLAVASVLCLVL